MAADATPDRAPDATPDRAPDATPDRAPDATPDRAPDATPDSAPDRAPEAGSTLPLADLTDRPAPTPGPLTKPAPVVRPPRRRARWLVPLIVIVALAATAGGIVLWQIS